ncbi:E3 ubiquitin-protein ligase RNF19B [Stigmatopora nigra]
MKRPKQQAGGPLGFLNFFSRKPKSEKPAEAKTPKDEVALTLTLSQQPERDQTVTDQTEERIPPGADSPSPESPETQEAPAGATGQAPSPSGSDGDDRLEECPLCLLSQPRRHFPTLLGCPHRTCGDCLRRYLRLEISESRVGIACPQCPEALAPPDVRAILDEPALLEKFEDYHLRRFLAADPDARWCPAPDCGYAVIAYGCAECPKLSCGRPGCRTHFCYHCRQLWHPNQTCDQARRQRARHALGADDAAAAAPLYVFNEEPGADAEEIKACPRCGAYIMKTNDGSCNRMNCTVCACQFCWLCMQEITDVHYLSPSGCTFWGKKPWSQTRKVLWQVGMLLGAPVVISLIAGLAIPVIIVGIPIYMGRKVHGRCKKNDISGSKHYLTVASGVMMSVFVSPVIAAVTVGVGVPLMLTYVYGVVPMSLCRNGWCRPPADAPDTLEDLASYLLFSHVVADHWRAQNGPALTDTSLQEVSTQEAGTPLPAQASQPPPEDPPERQPVHDIASRDGTNIEVRVEIETQRRGARQSSLSSVLSGRSLSAESLGRRADGNALPVFESDDA